MPVESTQAEAIKELVALASQARGLEIITIENVAEAPGIPEQIPIAVRHGTTPELINLASFFDSWRDRPSAKRGTAKALALASFIDLTNRHKTMHSVVFAKTDWRAPSLIAVIDYHEIDDVPEIKPEDITITPAGACDPADAAEMATAFVYNPPRPDNMRHRIGYDYPLSEGWKFWVQNDGKAFDQGDFAALVEDRIADLAAPEDEERSLLEEKFETKIASPADLMRLSRGLQVNVESKIKNIVSLQSGAAQIQFEEVHKDSDGQPLTVPGLFILAIAPFASGTSIRLPVRLRYRKRGGTIEWFYQMYRPDQYITERLRLDIAEVAEKTGLPVYEGTPET